MQKYIFLPLLVVALLFVSGVNGQELSANSSPVSGPSRKLTASEVGDWRADLHYLAQTLPAKHANLFHRLDREVYEKAVKDLDAKLADLTPQQIALEMGRIVALARDGHSSLAVIWEPKLKFRFLPIRFYVFSDGVFVTEAAREYEHLIGAELKGVESLTVEEAIARIGPYASTDNHFGIMEYAPYFLASPTALNALGISSSSDSTSFEFEKDGKRFKAAATVDPGKDHSLNAIMNGSSSWANVRDGASNPLPLTNKHPEKGHWFEFVKERKLLFVQMNNVVDGQDKTIEQFFGEVVEAAKTNGAEKLVLDLRHNGGGNNTLIRPIIRGLIQLQNIDQKGKLFVIIGRRTFSAAQNLVNRLESWTNASFVGEPTGSHVNMYGDARTFNLPKSGLRLRISELFWQNKHARDQRKWTAPHVAAEPNFADYSKNIDPAMNAIEIFESRPTLDELAMSRYKTMDLAGFREDAVRFKSDPVNKYVEIESQINGYGYNMIELKQFDAAIGLFKINVELYPDSWNAYDSLAEAYMHKGDMETATRFYKKSLEMNPENTNAVQMLERIKNGPADGTGERH